jgi:hypothetical protein
MPRTKDVPCGGSAYFNCGDWSGTCTSEFGNTEYCSVATLREGACRHADGRWVGGGGSVGETVGMTRFNINCLLWLGGLTKILSSLSEDPVRYTKALLGLKVINGDNERVPWPAQATKFCNLVCTPG